MADIPSNSPIDSPLEDAHASYQIQQSTSSPIAEISIMPEVGEAIDINTSQPNDVGVVGKKRERKVKCPVCKVDGHYKKTCPQKGDLEEPSSIVVASSSSSLYKDVSAPYRGVQIAAHEHDHAHVPISNHEHGLIVVNEHNHYHEHSMGYRDCHRASNQSSLAGSATIKVKGLKRFPSKKSKWTQEYHRRNEGKHTPAEVANTDRRCCIICSKKSHLKCKQCDIFIHATCWEQFHDSESPWNL